MESQDHKTVDNAIKLVGETFVPGASLFLDGQILPGGAHLLIGSWARVALGPVGWAVVIANSYSKSTTGKGLLKHFKTIATEAKAKISKSEAPKAEAHKAETAPAAS